MNRLARQTRMFVAGASGPAWQAGPTRERPMVRKTLLVALLVTLPAFGHDRKNKTLDGFACMSWAELEMLYRSLEPGCTPNGFHRGKVIYPECEHGAKRKQRAADFFWKGKVF